MLLELTVKDIALIRECTVNFGPGLNIMTGETGAGKSVIIGSALLCLGGKLRGDIIRNGAESAYMEMVFDIDRPSVKKRLQEAGFEVPEDNTVIISRKISPTRSISRWNGENISLTELRKAAVCLMDIYGQNEYHTLYDPENHLEILDSYLHQELEEPGKRTAEKYRTYLRAKEKAASFTMDEPERLREISRYTFEIEEIEEADLREGEEEELSDRYRKLTNSRKIAQLLDEAYGLLSESRLSRAVSCVKEAMRFDEELQEIGEELSDAVSILNDAEKDLTAYVSSLDMAEEALYETEKRLDLIRSILAKYGRTPADVSRYLESRKERLQGLYSYEENRRKAEEELRTAESELKTACETLSVIRKKGAERLCRDISGKLLDLGFESVQFRMDFQEKAFSENGSDRVLFMASLNPGEPVKPLCDAASGGELSRVMLSVKTVLAETDDTPTLVFDEVDSGISGRTAQKVAEKLSLIAENHQVICITHLPQIASMADRHFLIEKSEESGRNVTRIFTLTEEESVQELSRLLGGAEITDAVRKNAAEMKSLAEAIKKERNGWKESK